jgi:hypothetical protein
MTPGVAHQELAKTAERLEGFETALDDLLSSFEQFRIGAERLSPGEAEITLLIPREAVHSKLNEFADELKKLKFVLNTFSQLASEKTDDFRIRTLSSSGLMVYLAAAPVLAAILAKVIDFIVSQYKKILEIKKLQLEIARLELPEEISDKTKEHANSFMEAQIEKFAVELVDQYPLPKGNPNHELGVAVRVSLSRLANRIDRGFNFEVRIEPPKEPAKDPQVQQAVQAIQAASGNMQYMKLEGPPILALPETIEPGGEENKAVPEAKPKKKTAAKKVEPEE